MARARRALPRPGKRLPERRKGAGAGARAEVAPGAETLQAGDRKTHLEARAAGEIASTYRTASRRAGRPRFALARDLLTAEPDARGDRDERRLRRPERLRNVHIPRLEEQRGTAYRVGQAHPDIPGELGLGRVGGGAPGRNRELHVVNA